MSRSYRLFHGGARPHCPLSSHTVRSTSRCWVSSLSADSAQAQFMRWLQNLAATWAETETFRRDWPGQFCTRHAARRPVTAAMSVGAQGGERREFKHIGANPSSGAEPLRNFRQYT